MNKLEHGLETAGKDVLKAIESPVTLLEKTVKVLETAIKDNSQVKDVVTQVVKDGTSIAVDLGAVIASKGANWTADAELVSQVEAFFQNDVLGKLVPLVEQVYGEIKTDLANPAATPAPAPAA